VTAVHVCRHVAVAQLAVALALTPGCATPTDEPQHEPAAEPPPSGPAPAADAIALLEPTEHLTRASIALRGMRPSVDELQAVRDDARYVEAIVDYYLTTPAFGETLRELHGEALLSDVDAVIYPAGFPAIGALAGRGVQEINRSIVEAPLRLIEHVITHDRPYTEIVTADYTLADDVVATVWGLPYDSGGERWQRTRYQDGRPHAGILSDSFLFTRHSTTFSNKSRGRANVISRALLCYDFLDREIAIDSGIDLADPEAVADAVRHNPACASCHQALDPLASHFASYYPIYVPADLTQYPFSTYEPSFRSVFSVTEPGYFGVSQRDVAELGRSIADDPRFSLCAAKRFYGHLAQVELDAVPAALASELQAVLIDSGMDAKALARAVVMSNAFRASHASSDADAEALVGLKKMAPSQLARTVQALTGYRWRADLPIAIGQDMSEVGEIDLMRDAFFGFEVLAGGIDGSSVTRRSHTMSASAALTVEALAARAADAVVDADFAEPDAHERRLLTQVDPEDLDTESVRAQLTDLQLRFYGQLAEADDDDVEDATRLFFAALAASDDGRRAWKLTLHAMLQDARMIYY
jgi:hypothetical protein